MERVISQEARISRAEEIYNRRKYEQGIRVPQKMVNMKTKRKKKYLKKIWFCVQIYLIIVIVQNYNFIFSEAIIQKTRRNIKI